MVSDMNATCQSYSEQLCLVAHTHHHAGMLPFTGVDILLLLIVATVLVLAGLAVRMIH